MNRICLVAVIALAAAPRAMADISDSGMLTIGGQAIIGGTTTIQGNAFSVGGSTLSVSLGAVGIGTSNPTQALDVNTSGSVVVRNGASYSTITASGFYGSFNGSGASLNSVPDSALSSNVVLRNTTQTLTGANTFTSTVTMYGPQVNFVSSATVSAVTSVTLGLIYTTTATYTCWYNLLWNTTAGALELRINGDSGSNYAWAMNAWAATGAGGAASNSTTYLALDDDTVRAGFGNAIQGHVNLNFTNSAALGFTFISGYQNSVGNMESAEGAGYWASNAVPTNVTFRSSAGNFSGVIECSGHM